MRGLQLEGECLGQIVVLHVASAPGGSGHQPACSQSWGVAEVPINVPHRLGDFERRQLQAGVW